MDQDLTRAIQEAYASAPQDVVILHSLEINHRSFETPIRVLRWSSGPRPIFFRCRLEDDAPYDPGRTVDFLAAPFEITLPEQESETLGQFVIRVDNVGDLLDQHFEDAALEGGTISAIYREFVKGQELEGPGAVWHGITITNPRMEGMAIVADGAVLDWMFRKFGRLYLPGDYPGITVGR